MSCKSIIAVASRGKEDEALLAASARLALLLSAHVRVLPAFAEPDAELIYCGLEKVLAFERESQKRLEGLARDIADREGLSAGNGAVPVSMIVEKRARGPATEFAHAAVLADLVLFAGRPVRRGLAHGNLFAEALINRRAPILLVKGGVFAVDIAAIAWDGSAEVGRAVRAALPILRRAREVVILQNSGEISPANRAAASPALLQHYLALHGTPAARVEKMEGSEVARAVLDAARRARCDIVIAGAYGRPRLYELMLGGITRALIDAEDAPHMLLAH